MTLHRIAGPDLDVRQLYAIWRIRDAVFALEQHAEDVDADGIDLDPQVTHWWTADKDGLTSYLRTIAVDDGLKVTRVCTRKNARGRGLSGRLMRAVLERHGDGLIKLSAQAYLEDWYAGFGFTRYGEVYDDAGIPHVWMERATGLTGRPPRTGTAQRT